MSLALVQGYSSEEEALPKFLSDSDEDASEEEEVTEVSPPLEPRKPHQFVPPARTSILPTAFELFTEVRDYRTGLVMSVIVTVTDFIACLHLCLSSLLPGMMECLHFLFFHGYSVDLFIWRKHKRTMWDGA